MSDTSKGCGNADCQTCAKRLTPEEVREGMARQLHDLLAHVESGRCVYYSFGYILRDPKTDELESWGAHGGGFAGLRKSRVIDALEATANGLIADLGEAAQIVFDSPGVDGTDKVAS